MWLNKFQPSSSLVLFCELCASLLVNENMELFPVPTFIKNAESGGGEIGQRLKCHVYEPHGMSLIPKPKVGEESNF